MPSQVIPNQAYAFWVFVYIAAAVQAALLALALWRRPVNSEANRVLAVWVALTGMDLLVKAVYWNSLSPEWFSAYRFVALFPFLYGSLFYVYVRALIDARGFRVRDGVHLARLRRDAGVECGTGGPWPWPLRQPCWPGL
jgi:hypothetical protein